MELVCLIFAILTGAGVAVAAFTLLAGKMTASVLLAVAGAGIVVGSILVIKGRL